MFYLFLTDHDQSLHKLLKDRHWIQDVGHTVGHHQQGGDYTAAETV